MKVYFTFEIGKGVLMKNFLFQKQFLQAFENIYLKAAVFPLESKEIHFCKIHIVKEAIRPDSCSL